MVDLVATAASLGSDGTGSSNGHILPLVFLLKIVVDLLDIACFPGL